MATGKHTKSKQTSPSKSAAPMPSPKKQPVEVKISQTPRTEVKAHTPSKTKIVAHIDCGFANNLFIRGEGVATLSWDKGAPMKNIGPNEWVWESDRPFSTMQFKVLVNDTWYEQGNNHTAAFGQKIDLTPQF